MAKQDGMSEPVRWLAAGAGLAATLLLGVAPLVLGRGRPIWDADDSFAPMYSLIADFAQSGSLMRWNLWSVGGSPDFAEPQFGAASPLVLIFGWMFGPTLGSFITYWLFLWLAGSLGMLVLAKHFRLSPGAGFVVAAGWMFSGIWTGHAQHTSHIAMMAVFPWVVWRFDVALLTRGVWPAVEAGAILGLGALAGYPGLVVIWGLFLGVWALGRRIEGKSDLWHAIRSLVAVVGVCSVVVAPPYLGMLHSAAGYSDRAGVLTREVVVESNALHPGALASLSSPYLNALKWTNPTTLWSYTDISMTNVYVGAVVLVMAMAGVLVRPRKIERWVLLVIVMLFLALATSRALPLRGWLYDICYPTRYFRHSAIFRDVAVLALCMLAMLGLRDLPAVMRGLRAARGRLLVAAGVVALGAAAGFVWICISVENSSPYVVVGITHWALMWGGLMALALVAFWRPEKLRGGLIVVLILFAVVDAQGTALLNWQTIYRVDGVSAQNWRFLEEHRQPGIDQTQRGLDRIYRLNPFETSKNQILKLPALASYSAMSNEDHRAWIVNPGLIPLAIGSERIWFSREARRAAPSQELFTALSDAAGQGHCFIVLHDESSEVGPEALVGMPSASRIGIHLLEYIPDVLRFEVNAPTDGYLLVTERWARDWHAQVNGQPVDVVQANFIFRAIAVSEGHNRVEMSYTLPWYRPVVGMSWATLAGVALVSGMGAFRRGRARVNI